MITGELKSQVDRLWDAFWASGIAKSRFKNEAPPEPKADIAANGYDLSINRYKEVVYKQVELPAPSRQSKRWIRIWLIRYAAKSPR